MIIIWSEANSCQKYYLNQNGWFFLTFQYSDWSLKKVLLLPLNGIIRIKYDLVWVYQCVKSVFHSQNLHKVIKTLFSLRVKQPILRQNTSNKHDLKVKWTNLTTLNH